MKLKSFCTTKEMVSKLKRPSTEWEKIFASYSSNKRLITRIYRKRKKLNSIKMNKPTLAITEMQIKSTIRLYLSPVRITIIKNITNKKCW
jgi:hypothetical protein